MPAQQRSLGDLGEALACEYLQSKGYTVIETNWHCQRGELDIIAKHHNTLVFVEVKTRRVNDTAAAFAGITPGKRDRLIAAAYSYLSATGNDDSIWRIDAIGIAIQRQGTPVIDHVEDALGW